MTDDLIARLRSQRTEKGGYWPIPNLHDEAADALEAKDKRIAELEAEGALLRAANFGQSQTIDGYAARIAELEAALDNLSVAFVGELIVAGASIWDIEKVPALRAARAAMEGKDG